MNKSIFCGTATAIVTPFSNGKIDFDSFEKLVDIQIKSGINGLVFLGTTGESATLSDSEKFECMDFAVETVNKRVPVIIGTGSNDTSHSALLTEKAYEKGADAVLVVTPYYNKTTQKGLVSHYSYLSEHTSVPIIVYNVPSRTGLNIEPETYVELSKIKNIGAIKEANSNISKIAETFSLISDKLDVYSGNDDQIIPIMSLGGKGVISVLSNVLPKETSEMTRLFLNGNYNAALKMQLDLMPIIKALFSEVNPIPVKTALGYMGLCKNEVRLPLCEMDEIKAKKLLDIMKKFGLI